MRRSDRRQRGCFLLEAAHKRIRQDGKKRTKRPGDAFHVLYGGGEEGLARTCCGFRACGHSAGHAILWLLRRIVQWFPCARRRCVSTACLPKRVRLFQCILPYMAASPAFCWIWPRSISPAWGSPCMFWACSSTPDSLPGWSCAMSARALADTGKRF